MDVCWWLTACLSNPHAWLHSAALLPSFSPGCFVGLKPYITSEEPYYALVSLCSIADISVMSIGFHMCNIFSHPSNHSQIDTYHSLTVIHPLMPFSFSLLVLHCVGCRWFDSCVKHVTSACDSLAVNLTMQDRWFVRLTTSLRGLCALGLMIFGTLNVLIPEPRLMAHHELHLDFYFSPQPYSHGLCTVHLGHAAQWTFLAYSAVVTDSILFRS